MAQTGFTPIITYHSTSGAAVPDAANLSPGELAVNIADMKLYAENGSGVVTLLASADAAAGNFATVNTTNLEVTNIKAKDGTAAASIADSTGKVTVTTELAVDNLNFAGNAITSTDTDGNIDLTPNGTGEVNISKVDIAGGEIDAVTLGTNSPVTEAQIDNINIDGNTIAVTNTNGDLTLTPNGTGGLTVSGTNSVTVPNGTTAQRDGTPASGMLRFNSDSSEFEGYNGTAWASVGGSAISNDTSTASDLYPIYVDATTGTAANVYTSNAQYLFKPSTGELKVKAPVAANGIVVNAEAMSSDYTIDTGFNGFSVGPFTINGGVTLTIASGQRHVII